MTGSSVLGFRSRVSGPQVGIEASISGVNSWRGPSVRRHEQGAGVPGDALVGREPSEQYETFLTAVWAASRAADRLAFWTGFELRREEQLQTPECVAMGGMEQSVCAHAVQAFRGHMLEEAAQETRERAASCACAFDRDCRDR